MEDNSYYGSYEENERKNPLFKVVFIILAIIVLIVIVFFITRSCGGSNLESNLLDAGKKYYDENSDALPSSAAQCNLVSLSYLINEGIIKDSSSYSSCDDTATYVKVCKLENGSYHYVPVIQCGTKDDTLFGDWQEGSESDLVADKSDVRFTFIGQIYSSQAKQYYPNNKIDETEVKELYISLPDSNYTYKSAAVSGAAKWYAERTGTSYWNNGAYSSTAPAGYPNQGKEGTAVTKVSLEVPATASYRTIKYNQTVYRSRTGIAPTIFKYACSSATQVGIFISGKECELRTDGYTINLPDKNLYTCDNINAVDKDTVCQPSNWSAWTTTKCVASSNVECQTSNKGYVYTDRTWQWYVTGTYRSYYPSGSADASGEKTYYLEAPASGYVKDNTTVTTAYKYYKLVDSDDSTSSEGEWTDINDDYVELEELLSSFKEKGFEFTSLSDIDKNEETQYSIKLEYSNRQ